jgi:hypothetical protein
LGGERRRIKMNTTMRGHNLKVVALMALLAVLFVVAAAFATQVATTGDGDSAVHAKSAAGSSLTEDSHIDRHAEVVARYHGGSLR